MIKTANWKDIGTGLMIIGGVQIVGYHYGNDTAWWWLVLGGILLLAGLDLRYYEVRVKVRAEFDEALEAAQTMAEKRR